MFCQKCGNQMNDGAVFCPKCGNRIENNTVNNIPNRPITGNAAENTVAAGNVKKKLKAWKVVLITIAGTIVAGFVGLIALGSNSTNTGRQNAGTSVEVRESQSVEGLNELEASDAGALNELLGYIDQAEELVSEAHSDIQAIYDSEEAGPEMLREQAEVLANSLSGLSDLKNQADAVNGIDANLKNAMTEYFNMVCDSQKAFYEVCVFNADYLDLYGNVLGYIPQAADYDYSVADYYNGLYAWYEAAKEGYLAIDSCPSCLESEWKQYGEILDLNVSILDKLIDAGQYKDFLRYISALEMSDRYNIVEELQFDELLTCLDSEKSFFKNQRNMASKLAEEIHTYAELGDGERSGYEFEYVHTGKITLSYDAVDTIYPSLYNTYDAFVIIKTGCLSGSRKIVVEAEIPGLTQNYKESFTLDSAYRAIYIKPPALTGDLDLSSAKDAQINVTISEQDGTLIEAKTFPVTIKSKYDVEWYTDEYGVATKDNILCFLTPEASTISQLKRQAIEEISSMTGGRMESFVGYQSNPYNNVYIGTYLQAAGIMRALYEMGVRYNMDTFSISGSNQHVLFPEDVLEQQSGLCIETSLVVASALQSAGMHAFLIMPPGHAQVAVEIWPGKGEYFLIETTSLENSSNNQSIFVTYAKAILNDGVLGGEGNGPIIYYNQEEWMDYLSVEGTYIIDCDDSNVLGLVPFTN